MEMCRYACKREVRCGGDQTKAACGRACMVVVGALSCFSFRSIAPNRFDRSASSAIAYCSPPSPAASSSAATTYCSPSLRPGWGVENDSKHAPSAIHRSALSTNARTHIRDSYAHSGSSEPARRMATAPRIASPSSPSAVQQRAQIALPRTVTPYARTHARRHC
jgi:hypothetical protein